MKKKTDKNQKEIISTLRAVGASVVDTSAVGRGFPDIVVGYKGRTYLIEIKNPDTKGKLNARQIEFKHQWAGHYSVVDSAKSAIQVLGIEE